MAASACWLGCTWPARQPERSRKRGQVHERRSGAVGIAGRLSRTCQCLRRLHRDQMAEPFGTASNSRLSLLLARPRIPEMSPQFVIPASGIAVHDAPPFRLCQIPSSCVMPYASTDTYQGDTSRCVPECLLFHRDKWGRHGHWRWTAADKMRYLVRHLQVVP